MRINSLCVLARASCDAQLPLPRLPALQWRSFCLRLHHAGVGHSDHRHTQDVLGSCWQRQSRDSQLLLRLWLSSVHLRPGCARSTVHPICHTGQSVGVSADAGHLDIQCTTMGLPWSGNSPLSSVTLVRTAPPSHTSRRREHEVCGSIDITARFEPPTTCQHIHPRVPATVLPVLAPRCRPCRRKS
jgi:hypothetical protein